MPPSASDLHLAFSISRCDAFGKEDDRNVFKDGWGGFFFKLRKSQKTIWTPVWFIICWICFSVDINIVSSLFVSELWHSVMAAFSPQVHNLNAEGT